MLGSSAGHRGPGPQAGHLPLAQRRVACPPAISVRVAKRPTWSVLFALLPFFITAASKEDQTLLNMASGSDWPSANVTTTSTTEKPTILEHTQPGLHRAELSSTRSFHSTSPPPHSDALHDEGRKTKVPCLKSVGAESVSTSQDLGSPVGTSLGTTKGEATFPHSGSDIGSQDTAAFLVFTPPTRILPCSTSAPSYIASSRKKLFEQMTKYKSQEPDAFQPASNSPPSAVPVTLYPSSLSPSLTVKAMLPVTLPPSVTLMRSQPGKTTGGSTQEPQSLSIRLSSDTPVSRSIRPPNAFSWATAMGRSHLDPENSTASLLELTFPSDGNVTGLPTYSLPEATAESSLHPRSAADSILQGSQQPEASSELPLRNASSPVTSTTRAESSPDTANRSNQLVLETTTHIISLSVSGVSRHEVSLMATQLNLVTGAVGLLKEASPSLGHQSSLMDEHIERSAPTPLPAYFGTSEEHEVSLALHNTLNTSRVNGIKQELKDDGSPVANAYVGPSMGSVCDTISRDEMDTTSCLYGQTSSPLVFGTGLFENGTSMFRVPLLQTDLLESTANVVDYRKPVEMEYPGRTRQTAASLKERSTSKPSLSAMETGSVRVTFAGPSTEVVNETYALPRKGTGVMPLSHPNPATLSMSSRPASKESSEPEAITESSVTKVTRFATIKNDSALLSLPYFDTIEVLQPIGATISDGMAHTGGLPGVHSTTSTAVEHSGSSSKQVLTRPSQPYPIGSLPDTVGRSLVTPPHGSLSTSFPNSLFSATGIPEPTLKMGINITKGLLAWKEQIMPTNALLPTTRQTDTALSLGSTNTTDRAAPLLSTEASKIGLNTPAVTVSLGSTLGQKVPDVSTMAGPQMFATTAWHVHSTRHARSSKSEVPVSNTSSSPASSAAVLLSTPREHPTESKPTKRTICRTISCPGFFTASPSTFPPIVTSQPSLIRKFFITVSEATDAKKNVTPTVLADKVSSPKETHTAVLISPKTVTGFQDGHTSQPPVSKFNTSLLNQTVREENLTLTKPTLPILTVYTLWFRLLKIEYTESLKTKSSESYLKLEKEVKLTLNKMLSAYESFLQTNILRFLNGSVVVESQAVFHARGPVPTPSDLLRTIVTEVRIRGTDAFFDWKVDVKSLHSSGFSLKNLEPENLAVSFTLLRLGSRPTFSDRIIGQHLESLKSKMKVLLGNRYIVHWISLVDIGSSQGGIDVNGNIFIKSDVHVDIGWTLKVLMGLSNFSVDLMSLSINGSRLSLQVFPVSFLVTNRIFNEKMLDRSSVEHQNIATDLSDTLMHILGKYENLLQVAIREITGGSLMCHGDVIFRYPAPPSKDVLQTLAHSVGPKDYLDSSSFQVDPYSFTVAGTGLESSPQKLGVPGYAIAIIVLSLLVLMAGIILVWLPKVLGRRDKFIINRVRDTESGLEAFQLDNPGYHSAFEEEGGRHSYIPMETIG